jgi:hypothetical protein
MKKLTLITLVIIFGLSLKSSAQKLAENKVDDFTKDTIKNTSWETVYATLSTTVYFRVSKISDTTASAEYFNLKIMDGSRFSIDENEEMLFKMDNGDIVTIKNSKYTVTCRGCGSAGVFGTNMEGIDVSYRLPEDVIEKLKAGKVVKIRVHTNAGYYERDIKNRVAEKIQKCLALVE